MSKRNILAAFLLGAAMFAGTASADGKTKRIYKPGPAPLNVTCPTGYTKDTYNRCTRTITPRATTTCPTGYTKDKNGKCLRRVTQQRQTTCPSGFTRNAQGQCLRTMQSRPRVTAPPRRVTPAPIQQVSLDLSSFNGGVGAGISGGHYGGNGFVALSSTRSYSGVLDSAASIFTFNRRVQRPSNPMPMMPCNMGCGGMGGGD